MSLELTGKVTFIGDVEVVSEKFSKRIFVIEVQDGNYAKNIAMQFANDKCSKLDGISIGTTINVKFNLESREYNGKWFTNATAWYLGAGASQPQPTAETSTTQSEPTDSLPF